MCSSFRSFGLVHGNILCSSDSLSMLDSCSLSVYQSVSFSVYLCVSVFPFFLSFFLSLFEYPNVKALEKILTCYFDVLQKHE